MPKHPGTAWDGPGTDEPGTSRIASAMQKQRCWWSGASCCVVKFDAKTQAEPRGPMDGLASAHQRARISPTGKLSTPNCD
jgi:hypothetical protein